MEADHLDYFKDLADIQKSFHKFASLATFGVVANGDDPHTVQAMEGIDYVSFGLGEGNRIHAANMHRLAALWTDLRRRILLHMDMGVLGKHKCHERTGCRCLPGLGSRRRFSHGIDPSTARDGVMEFKNPTARIFMMTMHTTR